MRFGGKGEGVNGDLLIWPGGLGVSGLFAVVFIRRRFVLIVCGLGTYFMDVFWLVTAVRFVMLWRLDV